MARLEDITVGSHLTGIAGNEPVSVVAVKWYGTNVIEITYKNNRDVPGTQLLYREDEENIHVKDNHLLWSFDAQRLGLKAHAHDLNPVAVMINKAMIEIPPRFAGMAPVNPDARVNHMNAGWSRAQGLAEDVRYYGEWMKQEAFKRIGHLYPKVKVPREQGGGEATVIAWIWARTVKCPNPACGCEMPLASSFRLSSKKRYSAYIVPKYDVENKK